MSEVSLIATKCKNNADTLFLLSDIVYVRGEYCAQAQVDMISLIQQLLSEVRQKVPSFYSEDGKEEVFIMLNIYGVIILPFLIGSYDPLEDRPVDDVIGYFSL